ncbi:insecticidal delta-endotoxin Cry8Ea1 family protein [Bacillus solitudinis]|uniref:insecticidal delta-endotoxin Cry8Ea1 family protein n=1 Tax=Bacillus solitudinis TaxID=2014074 RepID=UPI000C24D3D0
MATNSSSFIQDLSSVEAVESIISEQLKYEIDFNYAAQVIISTGLGQIPTVGFVLSALTNILWPSTHQDVWSEIKEKVEKLIDEKLDHLVFQQVQESLEGLHNNINEYFDPTKYPDPINVYLDREIYSDAVGTADNSGPITLPSPSTKPITKIEVWAWDRIDGCQVSYEQGADRMGSPILRAWAIKMEVAQILLMEVCLTLIHTDRL